ncbi:MAG: hypothetical protein WDW38_009890 [Sanguina aurantia]
MLSAPDISVQTAADLIRIRQGRWCLFASYAMAAWAWRAWEYTVALVIVLYNPDDLRMVSIYGLLDNVVRVLCGAAVGTYIDRTDLVTSATHMLVFQNSCIIISAACGVALLQASFTSAALFWLPISGMMGAGACSSIGSSGVQISVERKMVAILCKDDAALLSKTNAGMRAIDLVCLLLAPLLSGVVMTYVDANAAVLLLGGYAAAAWVVEVLLLHRAALLVPSLRTGSSKASSTDSPAGSDGDSPCTTQSKVDIIPQGPHKATEMQPHGASPHPQPQPHPSHDGAHTDHSADSMSLSQSFRTKHTAPTQPAPPTSRGAELAGSQNPHQHHLPTENTFNAAAAAIPHQHRTSETASKEAAAAAAAAGAAAAAAAAAADKETTPFLTSTSAPSAASHTTQHASPSLRSLPHFPPSAPSYLDKLQTQLRSAFTAFCSPCVTYCRQSILLPCLALAMLYCTMLSLGFLMISYLSYAGMSPFKISIGRGVGALSGLAATVLFPPMQRYAGVDRTALAGILYQLLTLCVGVLPLAISTLHAGGGVASGVPARPLILLLVAGMVASRTGLWLYDLGVTQLLQDHVPPTQLGTVCGVQSSLQAMFEMLSFVAGIYLQDPAQCIWLMLASLFVVLCATLLVTIFVVRGAARCATSV